MELENLNRFINDMSHAELDQACLEAHKWQYKGDWSGYQHFDTTYYSVLLTQVKKDIDLSSLPNPELSYCNLIMYELTDRKRMEYREYLKGLLLQKEVDSGITEAVRNLQSSLSKLAS